MMRQKVKEEGEERKMAKIDKDTHVHTNKCKCGVCGGKGTVKETDKLMRGFLFVTDEEINDGYRRIGEKE